MGLFGRGRRPSRSRVAADGDEGDAPHHGGGAKKAPPASASSASATGKEDLGLFGADSDESDDDATIDRYANDDNGGDDAKGNGGGDGDKESGESKKVSVLLSRLSPEELFKRYDTDGSGNISIDEFLAMLPDLGIKMSEAKAIRIFKKCDTDGGGEIDLTEFKMAMFAVDPVSGNTLGFAPSNLLSPKDAFELFDTDGTGKIDELEFADVLEYFGMDVSDAKQEALFKKYDKDKSGYIDYKEFRSMWIRLSNVREELTKRGVEIPKYTTPWRLQEMLEKILDEEEAREAEVLAQAQRFLAKQREKQKRQELGRKAIVRAEDELAAALDAAGQVYVLGTGKYKQFMGRAVVRDEDLFPGFRAVSEIWDFRVDPKAPLEVDELNRPVSREQQQPSTTTSETPHNQPKGEEHGLPKLPEARSKYVRRRPENKRWGYQSPPKLNQQTIVTLQEQRKLLRQAAEMEAEASEDAEAARSTTVKAGGAAKDPPGVTPTESPTTTTTEDLARLFYQDRELVRSLRFRSTVLMKNTGSLWGRGVLQGSISDDVALIVTSHGNVFTWGGKDNPWDGSSVMRRMSVLDNDSDDEGNKALTESSSSSAETKAGTTPLHSPMTPRSSIVKMSTPKQRQGVQDTTLDLREEEEIEKRLKEEEEEKRYERMKTVVQYYNLWEPPPSNATKMLFMEQVLIHRLDYETMRKSIEYRGVQLDQVTKMELILALGECLELEIELKGIDASSAIKAQEETIKHCLESKEKQVKLQLESEKAKLFNMWEEMRQVRAERSKSIDERANAKEFERIRRTDASFEALVERRHVQLEDLVPEYTARGTNAKIELSGITTRGPALHSPRGRTAVATVVAGGSHAALILQNGALYTWGIGSNGRLGHRKKHPSALTSDTDHPELMHVLEGIPVRQVACAYSHSAAVSTTGALYVWGSTTNGQLGVGVVEDKYEQHTTVPLLVKFPGARAIRQVSCGAAHTGAVSTSGELFMWGSANGGRLGLGPEVRDCVVAPTLVRALVKAKVRVWMVSCGHAHSALSTEVTSELRGGSKKLLGGQVYVCGGAIALGRFVSTWELVPGLRDVGIAQVSCGATHTAAVSSYGELYTWGRNDNGCTGHRVQRAFIPEPELVRSLHVEPYNLALGKPCRQMSIYNEQGPHMAVNGDIDGRLARCIHTHLEDKPWWEVDLGQPAVIERIRVWNRTDAPLNPTKSRTEYTERLFPMWILVSEFPFKDLEGKEGLRAAKVQSAAFEQFTENKRLTEWVLPTAQTIGQFVRVQLQRREFLHLAEVEVFGVYSAFKYIGRVGSACAGNEATLVIVPPITQQSALDDYYLRAIQADADSATILRQFPAYERSYRAFGRGDGEVLAGKCRLCRVFRACELCEFAAGANLARFRDAHGRLPTRLVGDRMGLQELVRLAVDERGLEAEAQERERREQQAAEEEAAARRRAAEAEAAARAQATPKPRSPVALLRALGGGAGFGKGNNPAGKGAKKKRAQVVSALQLHDTQLTQHSSHCTTTTMLLTAMRGKGAATSSNGTRATTATAASGGGGGESTTTTPITAAVTPTRGVTSSSNVVGETPQPTAPPTTNNANHTSTNTNHATTASVPPHAAGTGATAGTTGGSAKRQRSIHDFFAQTNHSNSSNSSSSAAVIGNGHSNSVGKKKSLGASVGAVAAAAAAAAAAGRKRRSLTALPGGDHESVKKRIDYDDSDDDEPMAPSPSSPPSQSRSESDDSLGFFLPKPKRIDFEGICPSSQRSEPDGEPTLTPRHQPQQQQPPQHEVVTAIDSSQSFGGGRPLSQGGYYGGSGGMFSQDELDFCTPADQPVMHLSHPTTPSPIKKRQRRTHSVELIQADEVQNLTQDMTHMDVVPTAASIANGPAEPTILSLANMSSTDSTDMLLATPQRALGLPTAFLPGGRRREVRETSKSDKPPVGTASAPSGSGSSSAPSSSAMEPFTNPFAPLPPTDSRKRRPQRKRQSFPPTFGASASVPYSRYLSEFVEQELIGAGSFSKVFKCMKKIDGWVYAIKKSKRHFRGRADTERALREVQALAALSESRHIIRYFDAWIEEDLLYIQLENCTGCSLATLVDKFKPHHVPEETLCRVLCHIAQALRDMHSRKMVHMDVKIQNILIAPGDIYKLGDLGTVALSDGSMEITEGDNRYLSRELLEGNRSNLRAGDIFALGATIYELALGTALASGGEEWQKIRDGDLVLFRQYSNSLQHLIASMMHPDPLQRPSAEEILQHEVILPYCRQ